VRRPTSLQMRSHSVRQAAWERTLAMLGAGQRHLLCATAITHLSSRLRRDVRRCVISLILLATSTAAIVVAFQFVFPFPIEKLEQWPTSPRVEDRTGRPLLQLVGDDGQWRFPIPLDEMSPWIMQATIAAEDERFHEHSGVDTTAVLRAVLQNLYAAEVVSGASTISMQLCRMVDDRPRTITAKLIETSRAIQIERRYSKSEILEHYLNIAPYGGNVRGIEAASLRYFQKSAGNLSLGEAALLAGLPKSPTRFRPDRYPERAKIRQAYVLRRMREVGMISSRQEQLARSWQVDCRSESAQHDNDQRSAGNFRQSGAHAAWLGLRRRPEGGRTTINPTCQTTTETLVNHHLADLPAGADIAVVAIDIVNSEIVALVGSADFSDPVDGQVNGVLARRSPGSILKPFLYATAFDARRLNADSVVHDSAIERGGWRPDNFDRTFQGQMTVADALRESRNVPAILLLEALGTSRCIAVLEAAGVRFPKNAEQLGGLAIAVGAIETTLLDLTNAYATLGRKGRFAKPRLFVDEILEQRVVLSESACQTVNAILASTERVPRGCEGVPSSQLPWFMWKTGTSSGRRDAWAIGHNGRFAIGVWVGRFSGAGHEAFLGREAAEPLLTRLFTSQLFRTTNVPETPETILVDRRLKLMPDSSCSTPVIVSPASRSEWLCADGHSALIPLAVRNVEKVMFFLNGRPMPEMSNSLDLKPGSYELRCVAGNGSSTAVNFSVARN
jgi:penicillin-binding protein 1C